jgi:predicted ATPase
MEATMKKATIINLYGGPGTGKSTCANGLFRKMKKKGFKCEIPFEYAKKLTYEESFRKLSDQLHLFAEQHHQIFMVADKVDYVVMDSPVLLSNIYLDEYDHYYDAPSFKELVQKTYESYNNINIFLHRNNEYHPYQEYGRNQTLEEAMEIDQKILRYLNDNGIEYWNVNIGEDDVKDAYRIVKKHYKENHAID